MAKVQNSPNPILVEIAKFLVSFRAFPRDFQNRAQVVGVPRRDVSRKALPHRCDIGLVDLNSPFVAPRTTHARLEKLVEIMGAL